MTKLIFLLLWLQFSMTTTDEHLEMFTDSQMAAMCGFEEGRQSQRLHSQYFEGVEQHKDQEQIEKMLERFIKAVISYEKGDEK